MLKLVDIIDCWICTLLQRSRQEPECFVQVFWWCLAPKIESDALANLNLAIGLSPRRRPLLRGFISSDKIVIFKVTFYSYE